MEAMAAAAVMTATAGRRRRWRRQMAWAAWRRWRLRMVRTARCALSWLFGATETMTAAAAVMAALALGRRRGGLRLLERRSPVMGGAAG
jgi:hypothetical protein